MFAVNELTARNEFEIVRTRSLKTHSELIIKKHSGNCVVVKHIIIYFKTQQPTAVETSVTILELFRSLMVKTMRGLSLNFVTVFSVFKITDGFGVVFISKVQQCNC